MRRRGFTLLEILISMSLFTLIGLAVVMLMRTGVDMWLRGTRSSQQEDRLEQSLPRLEEDLRMTLLPAQRDRVPFDPKNPDPEKEPDPLPPVNRFVSGYITFKIRDTEYKCRYLAFVRDIEGLGELATYVARAGTNAKADAYIDGKNDEDEFKHNRHLPTGGAVEVLWLWLPDEDRPGVGSVYRAYRSPIGGAESLLDPRNYDDLKEIKENIKPQPIFQNVIMFDLSFWTQYTTTWDWEPGQPSIRSRPTTPEALRAGRRECGPSRTWDSTRGLLPNTGGGDSVFYLGKGKASLNFSGDDIWPRMARVEFALLEEDTVLARGLGTNDKDFVVLSGAFATGRGELDGRLMKIGSEWLQIAGRDGHQRDMFRIERRGLRGTTAVAHSPQTPVYYGRVFDFTISIPSFRDDNN